MTMLLVYSPDDVEVYRHPGRVVLRGVDTVRIQYPENPKDFSDRNNADLPRIAIRVAMLQSW
jgi:hypothetical protein